MTDDLNVACHALLDLAATQGVSTTEIIRLLRAATRTPRTAEIVAAYEAGVSVDTLAAAHGVKITTMYKRLRAAGAQMRRRGGPCGPRGSRNPDRDREMAELYMTGATLEQVGARYGVTRERV